MRRIPAVDLILFWGIIGTIGVAHSLLLTGGTPWETTTWFYIVLWLSSMTILMFSRILYKQKNQIDYDESLTESSLLYVFGGLAATIFVASILVRGYTRSSIWVPTPSLTLTIGTLSLNQVLNDLFFQLSLVANAEETNKLALTNVLMVRFGKSKMWGLKTGFYGAIVAPIAGWSTLHAYITYVGPLLPILVLSAFVSGLIIFYVIYKTKSILAGILVHFLFNASVIVGAALGLL